MGALSIAPYPKRSFSIRKKSHSACIAIGDPIIYDPVIEMLCDEAL